MWCKAAFKVGGKREGEKTTHTHIHTHTQWGGGEWGRRERDGEERKGKKGWVGGERRSKEIGGRHHI